MVLRERFGLSMSKVKANQVLGDHFSASSVSVGPAISFSYHFPLALLDYLEHIIGFENHLLVKCYNNKGLIHIRFRICGVVGKHRV